MDNVIHKTNTRKNIEDIAISVVIRSVILSFNVFKLRARNYNASLKLNTKKALSVKE